MTALYLFRFLIKALVLSDGYRFAILFTELDDRREESSAMVRLGICGFGGLAALCKCFFSNSLGNVLQELTFYQAVCDQPHVRFADEIIDCRLRVINGLHICMSKLIFYGLRIISPQEILVSLCCGIIRLITKQKGRQEIESICFSGSRLSI